MQQRCQVLYLVVLFLASAACLEVEEDNTDIEYGKFREPRKSKLLLEDEWEVVSRKKR
jgi:hypothetical protein